MDNNIWHHFPKVDLNKFDGSNLDGWLTQMEHYLSLHEITDDLIKLKVGFLYLEPKIWQWWEWHKKIIYLLLCLESLYYSYP